MSKVPEIKCSLGGACVMGHADVLSVDSGLIKRVWQWTDAGFVTREVTESTSGRTWRGTGASCDWQLPEGSEASGAELRSLTAEVRDDEGFTSEHICVTALIAYPAAGLLVRMSVWVYPGVGGIRTQLAVKHESGAPAASAGAVSWPAPFSSSSH